MNALATFSPHRLRQVIFGRTPHHRSNLANRTANPSMPPNRQITQSRDQPARIVNPSIFPPSGVLTPQATPHPPPSLILSCRSPA